MKRNGGIREKGLSIGEEGCATKTIGYRRKKRGHSGVDQKRGGKSGSNSKLVREIMHFTKPHFCSQKNFGLQKSRKKNEEKGRKNEGGVERDSQRIVTICSVTNVRESARILKSQ